MRKLTIGLLAVLAVVLIVASIVFAPAITACVNNWRYGVQKADDATSYETRKRVEDTCRAMIASYKADKATYEIYKDSENQEQLGWAESARVRANRTAATYNEYILNNSFVWAGNVPPDIKTELPLI